MRDIQKIPDTKSTDVRSRMKPNKRHMRIHTGEKPYLHHNFSLLVKPMEETARDHSETTDTSECNGEVIQEMPNPRPPEVRFRIKPSTQLYNFEKPPSTTGKKIHSCHMCSYITYEELHLKVRRLKKLHFTSFHCLT